MSVYIRLVTGVEDFYQAYEEETYQTYQTFDRDGDEDLATGWRKTGKFLNPTVKQLTDGSLEVSTGSNRQGYYPPGAWLSWRSD